MNVAKTSKADYGIDAPPVIRNLIIAGLACLAAGFVLNLLIAPFQAVVATVLLIWGLAAGLSMLVTAGLMVWSSKVGKLRERERLVDSLALRGDEIVLDVGCGHGLLLIAAARRLTTGKAIGIDLWRSQDQTGNHPEVTLANAQVEGVADRVEVRTGDMQELPFSEETIDVVVASLSIHNIPTQAGRIRAVQEIARVVKPNGQVALLDFQATADYGLALRRAGWQDVKRSGLRFSMFPPVRVVTGHKPVEPGVMPPVINFHGYGSNSAQEEALSGMSRKADQAGFLVVYPDGLNHAWFDGPGAGLDRYRCWPFTARPITSCLMKARVSAPWNRRFMTGPQRGHSAIDVMRHCLPLSPFKASRARLGRVVRAALK